MKREQIFAIFNILFRKYGNKRTGFGKGKENNFLKKGNYPFVSSTRFFGGENYYLKLIFAYFIQTFYN
jgi:hypothetical protein